MTGKPKRKFNSVDILLLLLIAAALGFGVYLAAGGLGTAGESVIIEYTVSVDLVRDELVADISKLQTGDTMIESVRGYYLGEIVGVEVRPAESDIANRVTGVVQRRPFPDHSEVIITLRADATVRDGRFFVRGNQILPGLEIFFRTPWFVSRGFCTSIKNLSEVTDDE